jgi:hypothetical protein
LVVSLTGITFAVAEITQVATVVSPCSNLGCLSALHDSGSIHTKMRLAATLPVAHQDAPVIEYETCCTAGVKVNAEDFRVFFFSKSAGGRELFSDKRVEAPQCYAALPCKIT